MPLSSPSFAIGIARTVGATTASVQLGASPALLPSVIIATHITTLVADDKVLVMLPDPADSSLTPIIIAKLSSNAQAANTVLRGPVSGAPADPVFGPLVAADIPWSPPSGLIFPSVQSAQAGANVLDDYEEGTWTPGISFGGGTTGITYGTQTGYYTKIGNLVTITGYVALTAKGSSTSAALITGLPFTSANNTGAVAAAALRFENIKFVNQYSGYIWANQAVINLAETTEAGAETQLVDTDFANNSTISFSMAYRAA